MSEITINFNEQAREAEKAVLGGLMLETERFDSVIIKISDQDAKLLDKTSKQVLKDFLTNYEKMELLNKEELEKTIKKLII